MTDKTEKKSHVATIERVGNWYLICFNCGDMEISIESDKSFKKIYCPFCKQEVIE